MSGVEEQILIDSYHCPYRRTQRYPWYWALRPKGKRTTIFLLSNRYIDENRFKRKIVVKKNFDISDFDNIEEVQCSYGCIGFICRDYVNDKLKLDVIELAKSYYYCGNFEDFDIF